MSLSTLVAALPRWVLRGQIRVFFFGCTYNNTERTHGNARACCICAIFEEENIPSGAFANRHWSEQRYLYSCYRAISQVQSTLSGFGRGPRTTPVSARRTQHTLGLCSRSRLRIPADTRRGSYTRFGTLANGYSETKRPGVTRLLFIGDSDTRRGHILTYPSFRSDIASE
jgi:hypothetical protein